MFMKMVKKKVECGIYKIISPQGKIYIGSSKNIHRRHLEYKNLKCELQFKLYNSFIKYGVDNHVFKTIEECSVEVLNCRERHWQDFYDVLNREKGLNLTLVECGAKRRTFSDEAKRKQANRQQGGKNPGAVPLINVITGEEFDCIKCVAKLENYTGSFSSKLHSVVTNDTPYILKSNYENYLLGIFTNVCIEKDKRLSIKIINVITGEIFNSVKDMSKTNHKFKYRTVLGWLKLKTDNPSPFIYLKDYDKTKDYSAKKNLLPLHRRGKKVINNSTGEIYASMKDASLSIGINISVFAKQLKEGSIPFSFHH